MKQIKKMKVNVKSLKQLYTEIYQSKSRMIPKNNDVDILKFHEEYFLYVFSSGVINHRGITTFV